jgi:hypothetical protein
MVVVFPPVRTEEPEDLAREIGSRSAPRGPGNRFEEET